MKSKKVMGAICLLCAIAVLSACTAQPASPEDVVKSFFSAAKSGDSAKMETLMDGEITGSSTSSSAESDGLSKLIMQKIEGEIVGSAQITGDSATVKVKITAPDMTKIMSTIIAKMLQQAMADALSGKSTTSSQASAAMEEAFESELAKADVTTSTKEFDMKLVKQNGQWLISASDDLADAITGGLLSAMGDINGTAD